MKLAAALVCLVLVVGCADTKKYVVEPPLKVDLPVAVAAAATTGDDYVQMAKVIPFTAGQKMAFDKKLAERNAAYDAWANGESGKRFDAVKRQQQSEEYRKLRAEQEALRLKLRKEFNLVLNLEQQRVWAGHMLYKAIAADLPRNMTDQQKQQAYQTCLNIAHPTVTPATASDNAYFKPDEATKAKALAAIKASAATTPATAKAK